MTEYKQVTFSDQPPISNNTSQHSKTYTSTYTQRVKEKAFSILGNKCRHCGIEDIDVLCIDHIEPVGSKNRKMTIQVCLDIIKRPSEAQAKYQLLCRNCNWKKMITNNERNARHDEPFALKSELQELRYGIQLLVSRIRRLEQAVRSKQMSEPGYELNKLAKIAYALRQHFTDENGKIDVKMLRTILREQAHYTIGHNKAYDIKTLLVYRYRTDFKGNT